MKPRQAHCLGCGNTFPKMHILINHRRTEKCGGRFLPQDERDLVDEAHHYRSHKEDYPEWEVLSEAAMQQFYFRRRVRFEQG